ncbi:Crp/Fnr family transcriptional regulator [Mesorhizobium sp. CN2-181]|uniref:Crp/Fnr family transcriptional regulator n=1 Tax=Mesorhizobium yinganensis TaxID=3157707 RepID=UPI0032B813A5
MANLRRRDVLPTGEAEMLEALHLRKADFAKGEEIVADGSRPHSSCLLEEGLAARSVVRANGSRQLTALHIGGDFVDLHGLTLREMDHGVVALTACKAVFVRHEEIRTITERAPHLTRLLWLLTTVDAAIQRRMTTLMGRHTPLERLGHLLCEMYVRKEAVGLAQEQQFKLPVSQAVLADLLGLSVVHTNRIVKDLRATGLVSWHQHNVRIHDFPKLARVSGFDAAYLSFRCEPR